MYTKTLMNVKILLGVLSNSSLVAHYSHSVNLKRRDASLMLLLIYVGMAYGFQREGHLEQTMYSMEEAAVVARELLADSAEACLLVETYRQYLMAAVVHNH